MTTHRLQSGGGRASNANYALFPAAYIEPTEVLNVTGARAPEVFTLSQTYDFGSQSTASALIQYVTEDTTGALLETVGSLDQDILAIAVPIGCRLDYAHYQVLTAGTAGLTFDLIRGTINASPAEPTATATLASGISGSALSQNLYTPGVFITAANQCLILRINEVPAGGLGNFKIRLTVQVTKFDGGLAY